VEGVDETSFPRYLLGRMEKEVTYMTYSIQSKKMWDGGGKKLVTTILPQNSHERKNAAEALIKDILNSHCTTGRHFKLSIGCDSSKRAERKRSRKRWRRATPQGVGEGKFKKALSLTTRSARENISSLHQ